MCVKKEESVGECVFLGVRDDLPLQLPLPLPLLLQRTSDLPERQAVSQHNAGYEGRKDDEA